MTAVAGTRAVFDVGGVGYAVSLTERHARSLRIGEEASVHTALIVREDDMSLFGFVDQTELGLFDLLRTVSGVGPKSALGVLGAMTADDIARAITEDDDAPFRAVSGIGPKTAKLIVVTLAGKLVAPAARRGAGAAAASVRPADASRASLIAALSGLGWAEKIAAEAADAVLAESDVADEPLPSLLRRALAQLGPSGGRP